MGVSLQHLLDQILREGRHEAGDQEIACQNFLVKFIGVWVLKRQIPARHRVQDNSTGPNVGAQSVVPLASDHLRSCVTGRPTGRFQLLPFCIGIRQAKVHDLDVVFVVEQQVLWLEIAVANSALVNVLHAADNLLEKSARLGLLESLALDDVFEELTTRCVLHNQKQLSRCLDDLTNS